VAREGVLVHDALGSRQARHLQFREDSLAAWDLSMAAIEDGRQLIALCEAPA
jgi:hypothetical protein